LGRVVLVLLPIGSLAMFSLAKKRLGRGSRNNRCLGFRV